MAINGTLDFNHIFNQLEPIARLSISRKQELASLCFIEKINKDIDPLRMNVHVAAQALYLVKGDLTLHYEDGSNAVLHAGTDAANHPIHTHGKIKDTIALSNIEIMRIDMDLLDIMLTWDELSGKNLTQATDAKTSKTTNIRSTGDWMNNTGVFSAFKLQSGVFCRLPAINVVEMFKRMTSIAVTAEQVIIQQGGTGDYYYLIQNGSATVTRIIDVSQPAVILAELDEGNAFGEEALVSDNKRNATVTMNTDGELLRLNKQDFIALLKAPLITQISRAEAEAKVTAGAIWVDARLPSEYQYDHIEGAINLPLNEIRQLTKGLEKGKEYILYCQTGRRSSAAAFILAELGLKINVLERGTRSNF
ncbi:MAG TPA: cyclic nucleotide-binding domain-containing protein [Methylotenera sp.]|nr:cyclic nucleotide-binding domain-containing protein [Methylotenera sp.]